MKLNLLLSALMVSTSVAAAAAPTIQVVGRAETTPVVFGETKMIKDKNGQDLMVGIFENTNKQFLNIDAVSPSGMHVYSTTVFHPGPGKRLDLRDVSFNDSGELVALVVNADQNGIAGQMISENLSTGARAVITEVGQTPQVLGRVRVNGKDLVAATVSLGHGPGDTYPELVRVVEETTGKVVQQVMLDQFVIYGHVGLDSHGKMKVVLAGKFLKLLDAESGSLIDLVPAVPDAYTGQVQTVLGKIITLTSKAAKKIHLLRPADLIEGVVRPVASYPEKTEFAGGEPASVAVIPLHNGNEIQIVDLASGRPLGGKISKHEKDSGAMGVEQILINNKGVPSVALVSEVVNPMTFQLGTLLRYIELRTGKVLRVAVNRKEQMFGEIRELANGNLIGVERTRFVKTHVTVANLTTGQIERDGDDQLIGLTFVSSASGELLALHEGANKQVCVETLTGALEETCVSDPLVVPAVKHGYKPFSTSTDLVRLPLLKPGSSFFTEMGFIDLQVK